MGGRQSTGQRLADLDARVGASGTSKRGETPRHLHRGFEVAIDQRLVHLRPQSEVDRRRVVSLGETHPDVISQERRERGERLDDGVQRGLGGQCVARGQGRIRAIEPAA